MYTSRHFIRIRPGPVAKRLIGGKTALGGTHQSNRDFGWSYPGDLFDAKLTRNEVMGLVRLLGDARGRGYKVEIITNHPRRAVSMQRDLDRLKNCTLGVVIERPTEDMWKIDEIFKVRASDYKIYFDLRTSPAGIKTVPVPKDTACSVAVEVEVASHMAKPNWIRAVVDALDERHLVDFGFFASQLLAGESKEEAEMELSRRSQGSPQAI